MRQFYPPLCRQFYWIRTELMEENIEIVCRDNPSQLKTY